MTTGPRQTEATRPEIRVLLDTPEGVPVSFALATPIERLFAYALDVLLSQVLTVVLVVTLLVGAWVDLSEHLLALALIGLFLFRHVYFLYFESRMHGSTPGKRVLGLRVVPRDGGALQLSAVITRTVLREMEVTVPIVLLADPEQFLGRAPPWLSVLGMAWIGVMVFLPVLSRERVRAGDLVAGTVVVRVPFLHLHEDEGRSSAPKALAFSARHLAHYGETELETLAELLRAHDAGRATNDDLATVADAICRRIGLASATVAVHPERFLREFYQAQRAELEGRLMMGERIADKHERAG